MTKSPSPPAVLIVDEDLGFVGWLGELFREAGYRTLPALNCRQAVSLIKKFKLNVDVIAVNEGLPGVSGMIGTLKRARRPLKIVAIRDPAANPMQGIPADAILERPSGRDPISRPDWLQNILNVLKQADAQGAL
jgi:hypothetical protein